MKKFSIFLLIVFVLVLLQIPAHSTSNNFQIPGKSTYYPVHRGYMVRITTLGLENVSKNITVNGMEFSLNDNQSLLFNNLSGVITINSEIGHYLLEVYIYPPSYYFFFYFSIGILIASSPIAVWFMRRMKFV